MQIKKVIKFLVLLVLPAVAVVLIIGKSLPKIAHADLGPTTTTSVQFVSSVITVDGFVTAQNQATLNFQTGGKLIYLPYKAGDTVPAGHVIAQLDNYALQRQLTLALNNYRTVRDNFDQAQDNAQDNVTKAQIKPGFVNANVDNSALVDTALQRMLDQSQAGLDNSVINVELANYSLQLSKLVSPIRGILTHEDVTVSGINITPAASFTIADPDSMVFRANVPLENIYYVTEGSQVAISVDGLADKISGTVLRIYPAKVTLPSGEAVYQVDIQSPDLKKLAKLDETGTAIITTHSENVALVPAWTVLSGKFIWIDRDGSPELVEVSVGKIHGNEIEITGGLSAADKIITDPEYISSLRYKIL
jgi:multidrug efflux pump subunit AcrA (membrane-fusion protein)